MTVRSRLNTQVRAWASGINGGENYTARGRPAEAAAVLSAIAGLPAEFRPNRMLFGANRGGTDVHIMGALDPDTALSDFGASGGSENYQASVRYKADRRLAQMVLVGERSSSVVHEWGHIVDFAWARSQGDDRDLSRTYLPWYQQSGDEVSLSYSDTYQEWFAEYFRWRHFQSLRVLLEAGTNRVDRLQENDRVWRSLFPFVTPWSEIDSFPAATTSVTASGWQRPQAPDTTEVPALVTLNADGSATFTTTKPTGAPLFQQGTIESTIALPATKHVRFAVDVTVPAGPALLRFRFGQGSGLSSRTFAHRVVPTGQHTVEASVVATGWSDLRVQTYIDYTSRAGNLGATVSRPRVWRS